MRLGPLVPLLLGAVIGGAFADAVAQVLPPPIPAADACGNYGFETSAEPALRSAALETTDAALAGCFGFDAGTFCTTGWGWQWFGARVVNGVITFRAWSNLFNVPDPCPLTFTFHFGDGSSQTAPGQSTSSASYVQVTHKYAQTGSYTITITASNGESSLDCTMTTISVVACWQDGVLCYQGEELVWNRSGSAGTLDIAPPARINQTLYASGHSRVEYTYEGSTLKTSTFKPTGRLYVPTAPAETVLFEQAPFFDVKWSAGELRPLDGTFRRFDFEPGGLPVWVSDLPIIVEAASVKVQPVTVVGILDTAEIARFTSTWRVSAAGVQVLDFALVSGSLTPSLTFGGLEVSYAPPPADVTTVKMSLQVPFSGGPSFAGEYTLAPCGLNLADVTLGGLFEPVPVVSYGPFALGITGWRSALDHICDGQGRVLTLAGNLDVTVGGVPIPGEFFSIENVGLTYEHPLEFRILGGTAKALGFDVAQISGFVHGQRYPLGVTLTGTLDVAGAIVGRAQGLHSLSRLWVSGTVFGVGRIPDFPCAWWDQPCKAMRGLARVALGSLPYEVSGQSFHYDGSYNQAKGTWSGSFIGEFATRSGSLVLVVQVLNGATSILVGTNMENLFGASLPVQALGATASVERSITLPPGLASVTFAATGTASTPSTITLRTPDGRTFTAQAPGYALFSASAADQTALFEVPYPDPGAWTLSAGGVPADEIALFAFTPKAAPQVAFARADQVGSAVEVEISIDPPSATTLVQLHYGTTSAGGVGEPIGEALAAASGTVTASWDTSALPPGTYYLFAVATEGGTFPVTVYADAPIVVPGSSPLDAPTELAGSRDGDTAELTWTPATAPEAVAHVVLYTDQPGAAGYPYAQAATLPDRATITGLDEASGYRFAVVAVDDQDAYGPPSNELVLAGSGGGCVLTCGATVAETAARREPVSFQGAVTAADCTAPVVVDWTFGDGGSARGSVASHAYATAGGYSWQMSASAGAGTCTSSGTIAVSDSDPPARRRLRRSLR